jgi:hypothetical protein
MAERGRRAAQQADEPRPRRRIGVWLITGVLLVGAGIGAYAAFQAVQNKISPKECTVSPTGGDSATLGNDQAGNAATIAAVARARGLPQRAVVVALATARQESKLRNVTYGDRDSLGLFQQRPSMGWGTAEQVQDPVYAAGKFYSELVKVKNWQTLDIGVAAQKVQKSADPGGSSYQQWEPLATVLAQSLTGDPGVSLTCAPDGPTALVEAPGADGLTPRAAAVGQGLTKAFGATTTTTNSGLPQYTHSADGLTVSTTPASDELARVYARWAVAQAQALSVDRVAFGDQVWTRDAGKWEKAGQPAAGGQVSITVLKGG